MSINVKDLWSSLPAELFQLITNTFESPLDLLRVRSVCTSWRASTPLASFEQHTRRLHLSPNVVLINSTICRMSFLHPHSLSNSKGWLTKVTTSETGRLKLLQPLCDSQVKYEPITLSSTDIRFENIAKASVLIDSNGKPLRGFKKVVCFNGNYDNKNSEFFVLAITHDCYKSVLCYWKHGDEKWTVLDDKNFEYNDIIEYKGKLYVVDRCGTISWVDPSSLNVVQCSSALPLGCLGGKKYLVESCGDLYVVDRERNSLLSKYVYYDAPSTLCSSTVNSWRFGRKKKIRVREKKIRVYRLNEELGRCDVVKEIGDRAFVLTNDCCFSISGKDFVGGKGNCIYLTKYDSCMGQELTQYDSRVYQLESRSIEGLWALPKYAEIFWPPKFSASHYPLAPARSDAFAG